MENLPTLQSQITSLMGVHWDSVMHADVFGSINNACKLDEQNAGNNIGEYHLATAVTTTVLMASVGASSQKGKADRVGLRHARMPSYQSGFCG